MTSSTALFDVADQPQVTVARVHVDVDLPHLDHPLDYLIPEEMADHVVPGALVKVRLAGRPHQGWVVELAQITPGERRLQPISAVVSRGPMLGASTYHLARQIAKRSVSTVSQVLSLAVPQRHASTAQRLRSVAPGSWPQLGSLLAEPASAQSDPSEISVDDEAYSHWEPYTHGASFLQSLAQGHAPRAVWTALPPARDEALASVAGVIRRLGRSVLIVVPTQAQMRALSQMLAQRLPDEQIVEYSADLPAGERYHTYLQALDGHAQIVVGTRSAMWLPMANLGMLIVWDDGDDRLREQRAPRVDALDVAMTRVGIDNCALIVGAWARSVKAQALVESGWAHALESSWEQRRVLVPKIRVEDAFIQQRDGAAAHGQITHTAHQMIRMALKSGPVLVQVPQSGFVPCVACQDCRELQRCPSCGGQLSVGAQRQIHCTWCAREVAQWTCPRCSGHRLRALRIGSDLTGEHLGRAFPGIPLVVSTAAHDVVDPVDTKPRLVVATPGREPQAQEGYSLVLIVDASAIALRPELWAPEEAMRRWMNAFALLSPQGQGYISGGVDPVLSQALIRWDPAYAAHNLLAERRELGFFPATTIIALDGPQGEVRDVLTRLDAEVMGMIPRDPESNESDSPVRALVRVPHTESAQTLHTLSTIQQGRSAKKLPLIRVTVNPPELF